MSHGDTVLEPPPGFHILAETSSTPVAAMADPARGLYGVQFHPEVIHTPHGKELLERFVVDVCKCGQNWTPESFVEDLVSKIRVEVGNAKVVCGVSGGALCWRWGRSWSLGGKNRSSVECKK